MTEIYSSLQSLEGTAVVDLFILDATALAGDILRFHRYGKEGSIFWQGEEYFPWPVEVEGFARTSEQPPTPRVSVANINGAITEYCRLFDDLLGASFIRVRTLAMYLDVDSFLGPNQILNGNFLENIDHWEISDPAFVGWNPGKLVIFGDFFYFGRSAHQVTVVPGNDYRLKFTVTGTDATFSVGSVPGSDNVIAFDTLPAGDYSYTVNSATADSIWVSFKTDNPGPTYISFVSFQADPGNPTADPTQELPREIWYVERKATENSKVVQFELASALDMNGVRLPRRQIIANYCSSLSNGGYRGPYCGYTGIAVAMADGTPTSDMDLDRCGGKLSDCRLRVWPADVINFGGFPAAGLIR